MCIIVKRNKRKLNVKTETAVRRKGLNKLLVDVKNYLLKYKLKEWCGLKRR